MDPKTEELPSEHPEELVSEHPEELVSEHPEERKETISSGTGKRNVSIEESPHPELNTTEEEKGNKPKEPHGSKELTKSKVKKEKQKKKSTDSKSKKNSKNSSEFGSEEAREVRGSRARSSKMDPERLGSAFKRQPTSKSLTNSHSSIASTASEVSLDQDIITLTVPETAQKIVHCLVGKDLFVDKTWCMVKKKDLLEDIAIEDENSPFVPLTTKILEYKPDELLIGYEPFGSEPNQFMLCITEEGRDQVLNKLEEMKTMYLQRIQQSKAVRPKKWESLGSEEFVNEFQIKHTRKLISLEWIGDISKRCQNPIFEDCDPDDMKNGYTCLVPSQKENFELVYRKTQETGIQAIASKVEVEVQTEPEISTNVSTQYTPETETVRASANDHELDQFFKKYMDYLEECLEYNEVYDLYHDDYPALYVPGEEMQVQQLGIYHQYQSFTDVAAIEGKLVISSSWHPNCTGIIAVAYANEIPCLMKELEFDSDQTDYEEEKTDEEGEQGDEPELGAGARDWLDEERKERESTSKNTEFYDRAMRRLKDIEATKQVWNAKIQEETEEIRRLTDDTEESDVFSKLLHYREYVPEPEPEPEPELEPEPEITGIEGEEKLEREISSQILEGEGEGEDEGGGEDEGDGEEIEWTESQGEEIEGDVLQPSQLEMPTVRVSSHRSKVSAPQQQEAGDEEAQHTVSHPEPSSSHILDEMFMQDAESYMTARTGTVVHTTTSQSPRQPSLLLRLSQSTAGSAYSTRKTTYSRKKYKKLDTPGKTTSKGLESTNSKSSVDSSSMDESRLLDAGKERDLYGESDFFDEITDEEEIKEKQDELPLLEVNNPVLIWSFVDDLTPKLRLDSPYEVRVVAFSKHNGNLVAGGTSSGQVVVWDITGRIEALEKPDSLTQNQQMYRKRMEDLMSWRRDIRSKRRVRFTAISNLKESHIDKIMDLTWVTPSFVVTDSMEIIPNPSSEYTLQIATCSIFGNFHVWDLKSEPAKGEYRRPPQIFKTKERFGRPSSLDSGVSPYHKLHRIWKPICKISIMYKSMPVPLMGFNTIASLPGKYVRVTPKLPGVKELMEERIEYRAVFSTEHKQIPHSMYISNLFGQAGTLSWDPSTMETPETVENIGNVYHYWDSYHDRPITKLCKHPFIASVCLSIGGHVWAVWHINNKEEPILLKRYFGAYITDGAWSSLRPSLIRIARSDGVVEIWDLIIQNHAPATTIVVSGCVITNISSPLLPEVRGLLGVADYNSAFCLFYIPQQFRVWTESELTRLTEFINREPKRRSKMKEWSKWWRENNVNVDREERKLIEEKKKMDEEVRLEKEKQEEARKKYNEEVYKWYMRRRGKSFLWTEEAEERWQQKQDKYMYEMVMAKKKIDRAEMEVLMRPIVREKNNEALKQAKAQERLKQADQLFRQTVELIFPKASKQIEVKCDGDEYLKEHVSKMVEYYFGDTFDEQADELADLVERSPWQINFEWAELLEKYIGLRMLFNDRRRKRNKTLRWLRRKLREELLRAGRKVHVRKSHLARYPKRKLQRRQENIDWLRETYGDDYNIDWDKHQPCRRFTDRKFRLPLFEDVDSSFTGELSELDVNVEGEESPWTEDEEKVETTLETVTKFNTEETREETIVSKRTALSTIDSQFTLGLKAVPSFISQGGEQTSLAATSQRTVAASARSQSPLYGSDITIESNVSDEIPSLVDNQLQELDYIQQPVGTKINTLQTKRTQTTQKREISHGIKVKFEDSISDEFLTEMSSSADVDAENDDERDSINESPQDGGEENSEDGVEESGGGEEGVEGEEGEESEGTIKVDEEVAQVDKTDSEI